jgi:hypothetical protein
MKKVRERVKSLESLRTQVSTREIWHREIEKTTEPQYDVKAVDRKIMILENFLFKADSAIKQSNATTDVDLDADVDALLAPLE